MLRWLKWGTAGVRTSKLQDLNDALRVIGNLLKFSQSVAEFATEIAKLDLLQGKLITGCRMDGTTNPNFFPHGLGRAFKGVIPIGQTWTNATAFAVYGPAQVVVANRDPSQVFGFISLTAPTNLVIDAWVF
ncbi:MAG: hypothetical protein QM778_33195 [Myxococcales bacterium]